MRVETLAEGVVLYQGDCREILPTLGRFDAVVTDPPYGISHTTSYGASWEGEQIKGDQDTSARDAIIEWAGDTPWAIFGSHKAQAPVRFKAKIIWDKEHFGCGDLTFPWKPSFEECWFSGKGWKSDYRGPGVWRGPCVVSWENHVNGRVHPHQKPIWLFEKIIRALPDAVSIFDPFMGSGTTGVAAVKLGRKFTGVELEPKYFDIACRRISDALKQPDMFVEPPAPAKQESFL